MTRKTGSVRIYLPATLLDLIPWEGGTPAPLALRRAHAVTSSLRELFPEEGDEGLEYAALLAAADDSLELLRMTPAAPPLRLVLAADVPAHVVTGVDDNDAAPSAVDVAVAVEWDAIACGHVDEPAAEPDIVAALTGDDAAIEHLDERDLLWYGASELDAIPR